jgi:hypothetical protein
LQPDNLPWIGATFVATTTGLPPLAIVISAYGLGTIAAPLPSLLAQGTPGCTLWVTPDLLLAEIATGGTHATSITLPANGAMVGQTLHHQLLPLSFGAQSNLNGISGSNGLSLTIGAF